MSAEAALEALVAHIYVVGGRAIGSPPPGFLVTVAPKRVARVRQDETLFILLIPNGTFKASAPIYEGLAKQVADLYFKTTGGVTSGLRETMIQLNRVIYDQQKQTLQPLRVSVMCGVMREAEIYLGRCGSMLAVFWDGQTLGSFPRERTRDNLNLAPPLGAVMEPRLELSRYDLQAGSLLVMADESFLEVSETDWVGVLQNQTIETVLDPLRKFVTAPLGHATVIQFVTEDTPTPIRPALPLSPVSAVLAEPAPLAIPTPIILETSPSDNLSSASEPPVEAPATSIPPQAPPEPLSERVEAESLPPRATGIRKVVAKTLTEVAETTSKVGDKIFPEPQAEPAPPRFALLSNLLFLLAFIIPLTIAVVVVGLVLSPTGQTEYELCRMDVLTLRDVARQTTPPDGASLDDAKAMEARQQWELVKTEALACEREKPADEEMLLTAGEAQNNLDRFDRVTRRDLQALRRFKAGADLHGPISGNWITLYTLDLANDEIYQDTLSEDGSILVAVDETPIIFKGQSIGIEIVDDLVDVDWLTRGGLPSGATNVPIALDESGLLIWRSENFEESEAFRLILPATWGQPVAITTWRLNLYVLDPSAQQIWRYVPNEGVYGDVPEEYFFGLGDVRPDLSQAIDLGIDEDGNLFLLFQDGRIKKFRGGEEQPFDLYNVPLGALKSGNSLYVDNNPLSRGLVVTDPLNQTLYTMSLGGTVNLGYRPRNQMNAFENLSGALVNPETNSIYVVAGEFLYHLPRQ